ncbi:hypothetical protein DCO58_08410 [Helicobacter saguini]|uniref:Uncharacterized protein n=1 Tax=Helicobacter saguini TaxID=1548018 RepID=A0A347VNS7_9HELI|nr:hypothetical protein [Helicobacter saguini]MWV61654.1 hypothetical protein [Helicobacter saguini]MWV67674.1 hypothetical protein [Helicobacter saguini]MWV70026.1 hypothetical protein [Helicobacter saguini]MWV72761.1 hypothetical protein [Helicobacter saguini]TLD92728.1 hypothetical protein LS64_009905 [Helicobacter saguini]
MIQPAHLQNLISQMATTKGKELNANLPMLLRILDKKGADKYLVQLGKLIIETQSNKELKIGTNYWANVKQGKDGLIISDLIKQPKMLETLSNARLKLTSSDLKELMSETQKGGRALESVFKEFLLERLPLATSKQEFLELSNLLVALQNGVFSMVIQDENGKDSLVQLKKQVDFLEFYSLFPHLGEISGVVSRGDFTFDSTDSASLDSEKLPDSIESSDINLRMQVMSNQVKNLLLKNIDSLKGFNEVRIDVGETTPLWDLSAFEPSYILNLKG